MKNDDDSVLSPATIDIATLEDLAAQSISNFGQPDTIIMSDRDIINFHMAFQQGVWRRTATAQKINDAWISNDNVDHTDYMIMSDAAKAFYNMGLERSLLK